MTLTEEGEKTGGDRTRSRIKRRKIDGVGRDSKDDDIYVKIHCTGNSLT